MYSCAWWNIARARRSIGCFCFLLETFTFVLSSVTTSDICDDSLSIRYQSGTFVSKRELFTLASSMCLAMLPTTRQTQNLSCVIAQMRSYVSTSWPAWSELWFHLKANRALRWTQASSAGSTRVKPLHFLQYILSSINHVRAQSFAEKAHQRWVIAVHRPYWNSDATNIDRNRIVEG